MVAQILGVARVDKLIGLHLRGLWLYELPSTVMALSNVARGFEILLSLKIPA